MRPPLDVKQDTIYGIYDIWISFTLGLGALILFVIVSTFFSPNFYPSISLIIAIILFLIISQNKEVTGTSCNLILFIVARTLIQYTIITFFINIIYVINGVDFINGINSKWIQITHFPVLFFSPILFINSLIISIKKNKCTYCTFCLLRNGAPSERGFAGRLHSREMLKIVNQMLLIGFTLSIAAWFYYLVIYNTANISSFDRFVFTGVPIVLWLIHEVSIGIRCSVLSKYCAKRQDVNSAFRMGNTLLRYLVISENELLLKAIDGDNNKIDTPVLAYIPYQEDISISQANTYFKELTNIEDSGGELRLLYRYNDKKNECDIRHYAYFLSKKECAKKLDGTWLQVRDIEEAYAEKRLSTSFKAETYKLYTALLAKKSYSLNGKRLFSVKDYKPVFDFRDMKRLNIDYGDSKWMLLSVLNEDTKFYKLKKLWFKYIEGLLD
ncbi:MAG: hypothetical protein RR383_07205 [Muribaculaceae bacterium]